MSHQLTSRSQSSKHVHHHASHAEHHARATHHAPHRKTHTQHPIAHHNTTPHHEAHIHAAHAGHHKHHAAHHAAKVHSYPLREQFLHEFIAALAIAAQQLKEARSMEVIHMIEPVQTAPVQPKPQMVRSQAALQAAQQQLRALLPAPQPVKKPSLPPEFTHPPQLAPLNERITVAGLARLEPYLNDPFVDSLECRGPDKNVLVTKAGVVNVTPLSLQESEIDSILKEISQKTRIPIIPGVFKAALNNLIITAVISEFVGSRFIVQKNRPPRPSVTQ